MMSTQSMVMGVVQTVKFRKGIVALMELKMDLFV
jgi:hypothetical protein